MNVRIEHVAMYVEDLEATKLFYIKYFGATANDMYHNPRTGLRTYFLSFDGGCRLEIMNKPALDNQEKTPLRTGFIHLAFSLGSKERVDQLAKLLADDGYQVLDGPRTTGDGYYEAAITDPEGNIIEITA